MFGNIKKNNTRSLDLKIRSDRFYDFMLYKGEIYSDNSSNQCIATSFEARGIKNVEEPWLSNYIWEGSINNGLNLNNIGFTGMDNGFIKLRRDYMTNNEFLDLVTGSTYSIPKDDFILRLFPVSGNTSTYHYPIELNDEYVSFKGGFYQGFYKVEGKDYSVLPLNIESDWNFEFVLRKQDYTVQPNTLNHKYPNNKGIFFFMGTRSENKFSIYYDIKNIDEGVGKLDGGYFLDFDPQYENDNSNSYLSRDPKLVDFITTAYNSECGCENCPENGEQNTYEEITENCIIDDYFQDEYTGFKGQPKNGLAIDDEYFNFDIDIDYQGEVETENGYKLNEFGYETFSTDNKFILFNHTETGYTTDKWSEDIERIDFIDLSEEEDDTNKFITFNHTETGYTTDKWEKERTNKRKEYDIFSDLKENVFCLKINEDGSMEYRYGVSDCDQPNGYSVISEKSKPNLIKDNEWATINVRASLVRPFNNECWTKIGTRKMKLYFYINGNLVLVSKPLPEFNFRGLNDVSDKQEGVPYCISIGGGTQGLIESLWLDNITVSDEVYTLMKDFGGTFLGDLKSFKFYDCFRDYTSINNTVFKGN